MVFEFSAEFAKKLDHEFLDEKVRRQFYIPADTIYLDGNSLGLCSKATEESLQRALTEWKELAIEGWLEGKPPWLWFGEYLGELLAPLVGAAKEEVVVANSITINIHNLFATFYQPHVGAKRKKIVIDELNFPTDTYAIIGQMNLKGVNHQKYLIRVQANDNNLIDENEVINALDKDTAIVFLPSVLYRSGQVLDMEKITNKAKELGILVGFDLAHSAGIIPHQLSKWGVDFAVWCNYKWLNAGPGSSAALYVNKKHFNTPVGLPGWWGHQKDTQFAMNPYFTPADTAAAFQTGTIPIFAAAPIEGAVKLIRSIGIEKIRATSLKMTSYLFYLLDNVLSKAPYNFVSPTPRADQNRGGHIAIAHPQEAFRINQALKTRKIIGDFRPPNIIRIAPSPLYNTFSDIYQFVVALREIIDLKEYEKFSEVRQAVT